MRSMATSRTSCIDPLYRHLSSGLAAVLLCVGGVAPSITLASASEPAAALTTDTQKLDEVPSPLSTQEGAVDLVNFTDQQIGSLLQQWPALNAIQRRDLLAEVRKRMRAAGESTNTPLVSQRAPSLTVRIQRAKTQHRYGKSAPRTPADEHGTHGSSDRTTDRPAEARNKPRGLPRDLVIRATVTRTLPDGSVVTTEETLVPQVVAERLAKGQGMDSVGPRVNTPQPANGEFRSSGTVTVVRTKVRFGAGFDRRRQEIEPAVKNGVPVRTISTANNDVPVDLAEER